MLGRLGSPAELAADVAQAGAAPLAARAMTGAWLRHRLARVRRRTWSVVGVIVVLAAIATGYLVYFLALGSLESAGASGWWYPQDYNREVDTTAHGATQTTVPLRSGQRQGYFVSIDNTTGVTQTILGPAYGPSVPRRGERDRPSGHWSASNHRSNVSWSPCDCAPTRSERPTNARADKSGPNAERSRPCTSVPTVGRNPTT